MEHCTDTLIPHCTTSLADIFGNSGFWIFAAFFAPAAIAYFFEECHGWLILKWLARIALCALMIPLAFLAWYMAAAVPVSIAILLGAGIIAVAVRSSAGRVRRLTAQPQQQELEREPQHYLHSTDA